MSRRVLTTLYLAVLVLCLAGTAGAVEDFTFLHLSDVHYPHAADQTRLTIAALPRGEFDLTPFGLRVPAPSFAVVTGDVNEFGGGSGDWEGYLAMWADLPFPVYHEPGNHDNTWDCARPRIRKLQGSVFFSLQKGGVKFIGWDSASPQDPRPSIALEGLLWLSDELSRTPVAQPIILFCHHPIEGKEFSSRYDHTRLLDLLSTRNVALLLVGHGHGARAWKIGGIDTVMGGNTYSDKRGFGIISIKDNVLRVCHQFLGDKPEMVKLLEKPLAQAPPSPQVVSVTPADGAMVRAGGRLQWRLELQGGDDVSAARWTLDDETSGEMGKEGDGWLAQLSAEGLAAGAHTLRLEALRGGDVCASRTVAFWLDDGAGRIAWKTRLSGSCQSQAAAAGDRLYLGANDDCLYCVEAATGDVVWRFVTGGEVRSRPAIDSPSGQVYFGSADGGLYCCDLDGKQLWRTDTGAAIYSSPLLAGNALVVANNAGDIIALDRATGKELWRNTEPGYAIEADLCSDGTRVYAGCWDRMVYAVDLATGALVWKAPSKGAEKEGGAARYYSPGDSGPVVVGDRLFVPDRAYCLTVLEAATGKQLLSEDKCAAIAAGPDGKHAYIRQSDGRVTKRTADGTVVWTAQVPTGYVPTPPTVADGYVWMVSGLGTVSCIDDATGQVVWQNKAFPDLYAFAAPAVAQGRVYLADMGGNLLALRAGR